MTVIGCPGRGITVIGCPGLGMTVIGCFGRGMTVVGCLDDDGVVGCALLGFGSCGFIGG